MIVTIVLDTKNEGDCVTLDRLAGVLAYPVETAIDPVLADDNDVENDPEHDTAGDPEPVKQPGTLTYSEEDVTNATRELATVCGLPAATALIKSYGVERGRDLVAGVQRDRYIAEAKMLVAEAKAKAEANAA
jgi:hypothetical protein